MTTMAAKLLLMAGLEFHSGRRLADHPELIAAIEAEAVAARNAEIAAAVRGLDDGYEGGWGGWIERAAVLAIVERSP